VLQNSMVAVVGLRAIDHGVSLYNLQIVQNAPLVYAHDIIMAALCNRGPLYFCPVISIVYLSSIFFSSPNLSGHRSDLYHTSTHGVALVRI